MIIPLLGLNSDKIMYIFIAGATISTCVTIILSFKLHNKKKKKKVKKTEHRIRILNKSESFRLWSDTNVNYEGL